jgi:hypothetical protein
MKLVREELLLQGRISQRTAKRYPKRPLQTAPEEAAAMRRSRCRANLIFEEAAAARSGARRGCCKPTKLTQAAATSYCKDQKQRSCCRLLQRALRELLQARAAAAGCCQTAATESMPKSNRQFHCAASCCKQMRLGQVAASQNLP